jgi:hypothetical protein
MFEVFVAASISIPLLYGCSCPDDPVLGPATDDAVPSLDVSGDAQDSPDIAWPEDSVQADAVSDDTGGDVKDVSSGCSQDAECAERVTTGICEVAVCVDNACLAMPIDDGTTCDDGDGCTEGTTCQAGACTAGSAIVCDDGNPCTVDSCSDGVCVATPDNGAPCDDDNSCTENDLCFSGDCKAGSNICTELCDNGVDDDLNGATDCEDFACAGEDDCLEVCALIGTLQCGTTTVVNLGEVTGSEKIDFWGCAGASFTGEELGYAFVATEPVSVTVTLASAPDGTALFELSNDATTCDKKFCTETSTSSVSFLATSDSTPTVVVDTVAGATGEVALEIDCVTCTPNCNGKSCGSDGCGGTCGVCGAGAACSSGACVNTPDNDNCTTPIFIAADNLPAFHTSDTSAAKDDLYLPTGNGCTGGASAGLGGRDVVYSFTPAATGQYLIAVDASYDSTLYVLDACDTPGDSCLAVSSSIGTQDEQLVAQLSQGVAYYIVVDGSSSAASGEFTLTVNTYPCTTVCTGKQCGPDGCGGTCGSCNSDLSCTAEGQCVALAENDSCATPSSIVSLPYNSTGNTTAANDDYVVFPEVCPGGPAFGLAGDEAPDVVYEVAVSSAGKYEITASPEATFDLLLSVRESCPGTSQQCLAGADAGGFGESESVEVVLEASQSVFILIDGASPGESGEFGLAVQKVECTPNCTGKSCGSDGCGSQCGVCDEAEVCTELGACVPVPTNDTCVAAQQIDELPFSDTGTLFGATADYSVGPNTCTGGPSSATYGAGPDVVYRYTADVTKTVKFSFDQGFTDFITYLFAVSDCDQIANSCVASPVSANFGGSVLVVPMTAGETVNIIVSGWSSSDIGNYLFLASEE